MALHFGSRTEIEQTWSNDTIKNAVQLKFTCGSNEYREILKQNISLLSE